MEDSGRKGNDEAFLREAIRLARESVDSGCGGPFGAVIVRDGRIVGRGQNRVTSLNDPTAHAEIQAIRDACAELGTFWLETCEIYTSCEPCPMCLGAIYWARLSRIHYAADRTDAASIGFDDEFLYREIPTPPAHRRIPMRQALREEALEAFRLWDASEDKTEY
jgi:guanine deaminase